MPEFDDNVDQTLFNQTKKAYGEHKLKLKKSSDIFIVVLLVQVHRMRFQVLH